MTKSAVLEQRGRPHRAAGAGCNDLSIANYNVSGSPAFQACRPITAFARHIEMPELGALDAGHAASLAGLARADRQSRRWIGRSFIRDGRAGVRQALSMPALVDARFNPDMKAKYNQLANAEKPAKVALTAVMRKLLVLANTLLNANRTWTPKTA